MSRTKQPDYDVKPDFQNLVESHRRLPLARFMNLIEGKLDDLTDMLLKPTPYDQGPGRQVPYILPAWYGPLPLTTPRRALAANGAEGFELSAKLADPFNFYVPRNGDLIVQRDMKMRVKSLSAFGFVNWGYTSQPFDDPDGFLVPTGTVNSQGVGDIFDPVGPNPSVGPNGGAMPLDYFGGTFSTLSSPQPNLPNIAFEVELYDKLRGRRMHDGRLPVEMFQGGRIAHKKTASEIVWPQGSRIEPRLFVTEIRMGSVLDTDLAYDAASVKAYVCLLFKGVANIEAPNL